MEVSKTISKGLHKNGGSIRELLLRSSTLNEAFTKLQGGISQDNVQVYGIMGPQLRNTIQEENPTMEEDNRTSDRQEYQMDDDIVGYGSGYNMQQSYKEDPELKYSEIYA